MRICTLSCIPPPSYLVLICTYSQYRINAKSKSNSRSIARHNSYSQKKEKPIRHEIYRQIMGLGLTMKSRSFRLPKSGTKTGNKNATPAVCDDDSKKCTIEGPSGVQQARRNLVKTDDVVSDRTIHLTDSWFNTSSRRLIVESPSAGKPPRRPTHTRNLSEDTASSSCSVDDSRLRAAKEFGLMIAKNKRLPTVCPGFVSSNHVLVNKERTALHLPALTRRLELDELAREFATAMAK